MGLQGTMKKHKQLLRQTTEIFDILLESSLEDTITMSLNVSITEKTWDKAFLFQERNITKQILKYNEET